MKHIMSCPIQASPLARRQRGASLLEGIAYLGIAALVVVGAVALMQGAFTNAQSNRSLEDVISIRTNVRKLYMGQGGTPYQPANMTADLIAARAFPTGLTINGNAVTNPWNGAVTVTQAAAGAQFTITYAAVPRDVCVNLLSGASGWTGITVNGVAVPNANLPVTPANAAAACNDDPSTIAWTAA